MCFSLFVSQNPRYGGYESFRISSGDNISQNDRGRYGNTALPLIAQSLFAIDAEPKHYEARIFGGATPLQTQSVTAGDARIGPRNLEVAENFLAQMRIPVVERKTGNNRGYRIYFDTSKGVVTTEEIIRSSDREEQLKQDISTGKQANKRVLIVDDSPLVCKLLGTAINEIPGYEVCGKAANAFEARDLLVSLKPDVMTLDIIMPKLDGISFLRKVMQHFPMPVVICSTIAKEGSAIRKDAFDAGAVEVIDKDSLELYKGLDKVKSVVETRLKSALAKFSVRR